MSTQKTALPYHQNLRQQATADLRGEALNRYISDMEHTIGDLRARLFAAHVTMATAVCALFGLVWKLFVSYP